MNSRRNFLKNTALLTSGIGLMSGTSIASAFSKNSPELADIFTLPPLPYAYDALEPYIDKQTMEIHHTKHHQAYVNNLNKALAEIKDSSDDLIRILKNVNEYPIAVRNNGGGHYNHSLFWKIMQPAKDNNAPEGKLSEAINAAFGDFAKFKEAFKKESLGRFGSGWTWLIQKDNNKLEIVSTANQDNPLMNIQGTRGVPIIGLDVWEHAYYLKYQNKRADYIDAWWNVVNWAEASTYIR